MNTRSIRFRLTVWYAGLLAGLLLLFGSSVYIGLSHYLDVTLGESLSKQARQIGETLLVNIAQSGEPYVIDEIREHFAPEINARFIRVTKSDGSVLYLSGTPRDASFDPAEFPPPDVSHPMSQGERSLRGGDVMISAVPFTARDGAPFLIEVGASMRQSESVLHGLLLTFAFGLPVVVAVAITGGYLLMRQALLPVGEITRSAEQLTSRNLSERVPVAATGDELEDLASALNRMIARIEHSFRHVNRFTADASHELRTPLTILRGELETIAQLPQVPPDVRDTIGSALEETERLSRIVESLLAISRLDAGEAFAIRERFDFAQLVAGTVEQMRLLAEDKHIVLSCDAPSPVEVVGDSGRLKQVIVNLLDNAIKYTRAGGSVRAMVRSENGYAIFEIADDGVGIPEAALSHVFERFYRVDKARSRQMGGAGLGLSIVKSICAAHGGEVDVESREGSGSRFTVRLPLDGASPDN
jgi:heavy metal sensor kinase